MDCLTFTRQLIFRHSYWRTDAPCANRSGGPNTKKNLQNIIGLPCLVNIAYLRRETWVCQYIGAQMPPVPLLMAHRTQKIDKLVRYKVCIKIKKIVSHHLLADRTKRSGPNISVHHAYFHTNCQLTGHNIEETEIR